MSSFTIPQVIKPDFGISARMFALSESAMAPTNQAVLAIDLIYFYPFVITRRINFSGGFVRVQTAGAGSSCKAGIWANSIVSDRPLGAPLFKDNTGVVTTSSSTNAALALGAGALDPGVYWFGSKFTGTLPTMACRPVNAFLMSLIGLPTAQALNISHLTYADTYSNNMPTIAEAASFSYVSSATCPIGFVTTA